MSVDQTRQVFVPRGSHGKHLPPEVALDEFEMFNPARPRVTLRKGMECPGFIQGGNPLRRAGNLLKPNPGYVPACTPFLRLRFEDEFPIRPHLDTAPKPVPSIEPTHAALATEESARPVVSPDADPLCDFGLETHGRVRNGGRLHRSGVYRVSSAAPDRNDDRGNQPRVEHRTTSRHHASSIENE
jgi:hypothetical protein